MRISWLSPDELSMARRELLALTPTWEAHFQPQFVAPPGPARISVEAWPLIAEHVARAERVTAVLQAEGLAAARARFGDSGVAIEAATLAAAAHFTNELTLDDVLATLRCAVDPYVFYANLLELMLEMSRTGSCAPGVALGEYEAFIANYEHALAPHVFGDERIAAACLGLADFCVSSGHYERAETIFQQRFASDPHDLAVALSASRAFLAAGALAMAVAWLERATARAQALGRTDMAVKLAQKRDVIAARMS